MKRLTIGILAHVDAGKTTLSEAMLYAGGSIRKLGRVDNGDAFLDTFELERARGITIFSKQAQLQCGDTEITLLDTPGHADFSAEMERTLQVLDYAVLVISGADGIQGHTQTLWRLLASYQIPVFLFINKMDQAGTDRMALLQELRAGLSENCVDFSISEADFVAGLPQEHTVEWFEQVAMCDEDALEQFLSQDRVEQEKIREMIVDRKLFPCFFGAALKMQGVEQLLSGLEAYSLERDYPAEFGARVFKITRDQQGNRLTHMKITGGQMKVKAAPTDSEEKVNQIRIYSGEKYETVPLIEAGCICTVTGLSDTYPGQGLGSEAGTSLPILEPVLSYRILLPEGMDAAWMLPKLRQMEEEEPGLHITWNETLKEIQAQIMGEVQIEILKDLIQSRFDVQVEFGDGNIVYKETIANQVEGVGHFEPLRHYAEVHLLLEPGEPGSGLQFASACSEDVLDRNWQRLVLTHLAEKEHCGVLTGSAITDIKLTLVSGRAHQKHTEGGDFRQATYRAVRQGLKQAESVLLEPYYEFRLELPQEMIGRAMTDIEQRRGTLSLPQTDDGMAVLTGSAPVATMRNYQKEVTAYTRGEGRLFCSLKGYGPCHNTDEVIRRFHYDSELDLENPAGSVFCAHGAGFVVPWDQVGEYMHLENYLTGPTKTAGSVADQEHSRAAAREVWLGTEEIDAILDRTYHANKRGHETRSKWKRTKTQPQLPSPAATRVYKQAKRREEYLLVDGYNIVFAWEELKSLASVNIDGARGRLMDILCNYQGIKKCNLILVFDAYRVQGHSTEVLEYHNIHVVYTKEAETADQYIEKFAYNHGREYDITVATSDGLEQIIIRGQGCKLLSARDLQEEIERTEKLLKEEYLDNQKQPKNYLSEHLPVEIIERNSENKP